MGSGGIGAAQGNRTQEFWISRKNLIGIKRHEVLFVEKDRQALAGQQLARLVDPLALLGLYKVRARAPVFIGDSPVEAVVAIVRKTKKTYTGISSIEYTVLKQDTQPIMTSNSNFLLKRNIDDRIGGFC